MGFKIGDLVQHCHPNRGFVSLAADGTSANRWTDGADVPSAAKRSAAKSRCNGRRYQAKWAKALLASAIRWTLSRLVMAAPSRL